MDDEDAICGQCGGTLQLVRPGKHQCDHCETVATLEDRRDEAAKLAGELLALIRVNHANDRFSVCSIEQLDEFLKPYDARLLAIRPLPTFPPTNASVEARQK
jgi:hypothetical protein